jgi:hypothetical protein
MTDFGSLSGLLAGVELFEGTPMTSRSTHSPNVQPERENPAEPNNACKTDWMKKHVVVDPFSAQLMATSPESASIVEVKLNP